MRPRAISSRAETCSSMPAGLVAIFFNFVD
jgi:hypothetical protein